MSDMNSVNLTGRVTRDPQVRYIQSGKAVCDLGLAVGRTWFDKQSNQRRENVTWVDVACWGRTAEIAGEYIRKGHQVAIEGHLELDEWDDKATGQKRQKLRVVCNHLIMLGGKSEQRQQDDSGFTPDAESTQGIGDEETPF